MNFGFGAAERMETVYAKTRRPLANYLMNMRFGYLTELRALVCRNSLNQARL